LDAGFVDLRKGVAQRLWPYDPKKEPPALSGNLEAFVQSGEPYLRNRVAHLGMSPGGLPRALHKLHGLTEARRNSETGEREFLLHRGMGLDEKNYTAVGDAHYKNTQASSWTPNKEVAGRFGETYGAADEVDHPPIVLSAWIPESKIGVSVPQTGIHSGPFEDEHEIIVKPGKYPLHSEVAKSEGALPKFSETPKSDKSLVFVHNLSEDNLKHAHELGGLAAPSIAIKNTNHAFDNFGNVTLVAHPSTFDPSKTPTFAADAYSPRHPSSKYEIHQGNLANLRKELLPHAQKLDRVSYLNNSLEDDIENHGVQKPLENHSFVPVLKSAFLASKGIDVKPVMREASMRWPDIVKTKAMRNFFSQNGTTGNGEPEQGFSSDYHKKMSDAFKGAVNEWTEGLRPKVAKDIKTNAHELHLDGRGLLWGPYVYRFMDDAQKYGQQEPDVAKTSEAIEKHFTPKLQKEFDKWALAKVKPVQSTPYIPKVSQNTGRVKRIPYTIENVLREMTQKVRAGEDFNYGLGNARAKGTPQLRSLMHTKAAKGRLVPHEEFEKAKKENDQRFFDIANKFSSEPGSNGFHKLDGLVEALGESFKPGRNLKTELEKSGFKDVPDHLVDELKTFGKTLLDMPSEYFESKPQRIVDLGEFKGAAVPHNVSPETLKILKQHGINNIERYREGNKDESEERKKAVLRVARKHDLMLSEDEWEFGVLSKGEETLEKMAIADLKPGKSMGSTAYDYSHLLPHATGDWQESEGLNSPLAMHVHTQPLFGSTGLVCYLRYGGHGGRAVGKVTGKVGHDNNLHIGFSQIEAPFRGKGYGKAMYEAVMAHAFHKMGAKTVEGEEHSTSAHQVHQALSEKHGLGYGAKRNMFENVVKPRAFDDAYGPYNYQIKSELQKSESEASRLLTHPNPIERSLAIKLDSATPEDVGVAILDPDPQVWAAAFNHPDSTHALDVLAAHTRDASGRTLFDRHDALLNDSRCLPRHVDSMIEATKRDSYLPISELATRIYQLRGHPLASHENNYGALTKSEWARDAVVNGAAHKVLTSAADEKPPLHLVKLKEAFQKHMEGHAQPLNKDLYESGEVSPKVVYTVPVEGEGELQHLMVKPYREKNHLLSGWSEGSTQELYHAAGMGNLCQPSFVAAYGKAGDQVPANVIHLKKGTSVLSVSQKHLAEANPDVKEQARKIAVMDFLTHNTNRHSGHLMVTPDNQLLAIDHSGAFEYSPDELELQPFAGYGPGIVAPWKPNEYENTLKWWPTVQQPVREAFKRRLGLVTDKDTKDFLATEFERRANWLDRRSNEASGRHFTEGETLGSPENNDWVNKYIKGKVQKTESLVLVKALEHGDLLLGTQGKNGGYDYRKLLKAYPKANQEQVDYFNNNLLNTSEPQSVQGHTYGGLEKKAVYGDNHTGSHRYMVKQFNSDKLSDHMNRGAYEGLAPLGGLNEMMSQSLYHAGGIGNLHQKVHIAEHPTLTGKKVPALVIHMEPESNTYNETRVANTMDRERGIGSIAPIFNKPEHQEALRKIGLMDYLTHNVDRHGQNILVTKEGAPLAIDHGLSFSGHHAVATGWDRPNEAEGDFENHLTALMPPGLKDEKAVESEPWKNTWGWWLKNEGKIKRAMVRHVNLFPEPDYQTKFLNNYLGRHDFLTQKAKEMVEGGKRQPPTETPEQVPGQNFPLAQTVPAAGDRTLKPRPGLDQTIKS
jgi:hypothetical protein